MFLKNNKEEKFFSLREKFRKYLSERLRKRKYEHLNKRFKL